MRTLERTLEGELKKLAKDDHLRLESFCEGINGIRLKLKERWLVLFSTNDYLGLGGNQLCPNSGPGLAHKTGFGSSRLLLGSNQEHLALEYSLAEVTGMQSALVFSSGYAANLGILSSILGSKDVAILDREAHASLIDGVRLANARLVVFKHNDLGAAEQMLKRFSSHPGRKVLITESLFSMSGRYAKLRELANLAEKYAAALYVDEAHSFGIMGKEGGGLCKSENIVPDILVGTLGKAVGCSGAFFAGSKTIRSYLYNRARSFFFSTGVPPLLAYVAKTNLGVLRGEDGEALRDKLWKNVATMHRCLGLGSEFVASPIIPWRVGGAAEAIRLSRYLMGKGFYVPAIRPPTVKEGTSRLRISISAAHQSAEIEALAESLLQYQGKGNK